MVGWPARTRVRRLPCEDDRQAATAAYGAVRLAVWAALPVAPHPLEARRLFGQALVSDGSGLAVQWVAGALLPCGQQCRGRRVLRDLVRDPGDRGGCRQGLFLVGACSGCTRAGATSPHTGSFPAVSLAGHIGYGAVLAGLPGCPGRPRSRLPASSTSCWSRSVCGCGPRPRRRSWRPPPCGSHCRCGAFGPAAQRAGTHAGAGRQLRDPGADVRVPQGDDDPYQLHWILTTDSGIPVEGALDRQGDGVVLEGDVM